METVMTKKLNEMLEHNKNESKINKKILQWHYVNLYSKLYAEYCFQFWSFAIKKKNNGNRKTLVEGHLQTD